MNHKYIISLLLAVLFCLVLPLHTFAQTNPAPAESADSAENNIPVTLEAISIATSQNKWKDVILLSNAYLAEHPDDVQVLSMQGLAYANTRQKAEALRNFTRINQLQPDQPEIIKNIALLKQDLKEKDALEYIIRSASLSPEDYSMQLYTAQALEKLKRFEEASPYYTKAIELNPTSMPAITGYCTMLSGMGEYSKAIEIYNKTIESGEENAILYINLVSTLYLAGKYQESIDLADKVLPKYHDSGIYLNKARSLSRLGEFSKAEEIFRNELSSKSASKPIENIEFAIALSMQGCSSEKQATCKSETPDICCAKDTEALNLLKNTAATPPSSQSPYASIFPLRLGLAHMTAGELEDAEVILREGLKKYQNDPKAAGNYFAAIAITLFKFGEPRDIENAVLMYREAVENSPDFADPQRVASIRQWPPTAIEELTKLKAYEENLRNPRPSGQASCGCQITTSPVTRTPLLFAFMAGLLFIVRRKFIISK